MKHKKNKEVNLTIVRWVNFLLGLILGLGIAILIQLYIHPAGSMVEPLSSIIVGYTSPADENKWPSGYGPLLRKVLDYLDHMAKTNDAQAADIHAMREKLAR